MTSTPTPVTAEAISAIPIDPELEQPPSSSVAISNSNDREDPAENSDDDINFGDKYEGIDWTRLPGLQKVARTVKRPPSWIFKYGHTCQRYWALTILNDNRSLSLS